MQIKLTTQRLQIAPLSLSDSEFIFKLLNTHEWKKFIGNRNIETITDAEEYIQKIISNLNVQYYTVKLKETLTSIGIITFIKRDYLEHHDIGFAFLAEYSKKGYGYEATLAVLSELIKDSSHTHILATTLKSNTNSIRLLQKLGLTYSKEIKVEKEALAVYEISVDKLTIDFLTSSFFAAFTTKNKQRPNLEILHSICLSETIILKKTPEKEEIYNLQSFIEPRKKMLLDGSLTDFEEMETSQETLITGNMAQRFSTYEKSGNLNGNIFKGNGKKSFQFINTTYGWKISSVIWEDTL